LSDAALGLGSEPALSTELREVRGPSAIGGGWRRFFELLYLISVTEFKRTYFGTVLGYLWSLLRPLMLFGVLLFIFTRVFRLGSNVEHYPVLLLFNIVLITFFQEATTQAVSSVVRQEGIVRKTQFPRLVIPLSVVVTSVFNLGVNLIAVLGFFLAFGIYPMWTWLLFPVIATLLFILTAAVSMIVSSLFVRFRDTLIIWSVVVTVLFYATPVLYAVEVVPEEYRDPILVNPLTPIFEQARRWIIDPNAPGAVDAAGGWVHLVPAIVIYLAICVAAVWLFDREAPRVAEEL
jgi:ABC-2 type transport system permease protein